MKFEDLKWEYEYSHTLQPTIRVAEASLSHGFNFKCISMTLNPEFHGACVYQLLIRSPERRVITTLLTWSPDEVTRALEFAEDVEIPMHLSDAAKDSSKSLRYLLSLAIPDTKYLIEYETHRDDEIRTYKTVSTTGDELIAEFKKASSATTGKYVGIYTFDDFTTTFLKDILI